MVGNHLPNSLMSSHKRFCGTTGRGKWHREDTDQVSAVTACHPGRIASPRFACRRGVDKDSYGFERHRKNFLSHL
jgi:hypothetical protein